MERATTPSTHEKLSDAALEKRITELSRHIIDITDSPARGMAEMEIDRDPESNGTEAAAEHGQIIPREEQTVDHLRTELRELELERDRRRKAAA